jgi:hypothetical protein
MAWSRLVGTVVGTLAVCGFMTTPAPAVGTWPASVQLGTSAAFPGDTVSFSGQGPLGVGSARTSRALHHRRGGPRMTSASTPATEAAVSSWLLPAADGARTGWSRP